LFNVVKFSKNQQNRTSLTHTS